MSVVSLGDKVVDDVGKITASVVVENIFKEDRRKQSLKEGEGFLPNDDDITMVGDDDIRAEDAAEKLMNHRRKRR